MKTSTVSHLFQYKCSIQLDNGAIPDIAGQRDGDGVVINMTVMMMM